MDPAISEQLDSWRDQTKKTHEMIGQIAMKQIEIASASITAHYTRMIEVQEKLLASAIVQYEKLIELEDRAKGKGGAGASGASPS